MSPLVSANISSNETLARQLNYDHKGAASFVCVVILLYGLGAVAITCSRLRMRSPAKKRLDDDAERYFRDLQSISRLIRKDEIIYLHRSLPPHVRKSLRRKSRCDSSSSTDNCSQIDEELDEPEVERHANFQGGQLEERAVEEEECRASFHEREKEENESEEEHCASFHGREKGCETPEDEGKQRQQSECPQNRVVTLEYFTVTV